MPDKIKQKQGDKVDSRQLTVNSIKIFLLQLCRLLFSVLLSGKSCALCAKSGFL